MTYSEEKSLPKVLITETQKDIKQIPAPINEGTVRFASNGGEMTT